MGQDSKIEWTDHTFNPWIGCTKVSPGCLHCYAETLMDTRYGRVQWGPGNPRSRTSEANWKSPLRWNREAFDATHERDWHRPRVFCASLADWLDAEVPIAWLAELLALIRATQNLDWLLLTKRPQNWAERIRLARNHLTVEDPETALWLNEWLPKRKSAGMPARAGVAPQNVWIGTTVEDQTRADERIPLLLTIPARVRFLSCEPLLGPLDIGDHIHILGRYFIDWVICGGESGPGARPMHPGWARSLRDQCDAAGVPFLFKQWGEWRPAHDSTASVPHTFGDGERMFRVGKHAAGRLLDGVEHNGFPEAAP